MLTEKPRLLIIDDNELNCDLVRFQLEDLAFSVDAESDSTVALCALSSTVYSLILLDLRMPRLNGYQVLQQIRNDPGLNRYTPVIAITAQELGIERRALLAEGFADLLYKPLDLNILVLAVARFFPAYISSFIATISATAQPSPSGLWSNLLTRFNGDVALAQSLMEKLLDELPRQMEHIDLALRSGRRASAQELVHKLFGSAAYCGLNEIKEAANTLERLLLLGGTDANESAACCRLNITIAALLQRRDEIMAEILSHRFISQPGLYNQSQPYC